MTRELEFISRCGEVGFNLSDEFLDWLKNNGYFSAPASTKYHGAYAGGLYDHSDAVYRRLADMTKKMGIVWQRSISPFVIAYFHDLCKIDQYKVKGEIAEMIKKYPEMAKDIEVEYEYNSHTLLKGHGSKSIILLSTFVKPTEEEALCIRYHMGAYETDEWEEFDMAIRKYPTVLWTHMADMLASKVDNT